MAGEFAYLALTDESVKDWATGDHLAEENSSHPLFEMKQLSGLLEPVAGLPFAVAEAVTAAANELLRKENLLPPGKKLTLVVAN